MPDLLPGAEIAGCRIEAVAGRGGMGIVYRATQLSLGRPVAVKLIAPDRAGDPGFRERFERESRVAAAIDHPNVIPVYAAGEEAGHLYLVMRYVKGIDLQALLARDRHLAPERVAAIAVQVGAALDAAHAVGLVHRDVKPANVLLGGDHAYLADFGLSQQVGTDARLTTTGQWIGTVDFMAPEQFRDGEVDARADVYALGCVLHNALCGEVPYPRGTVPATMLAHLHDEPPRPTAVADGVPAGFDRVIARALAKDPEARYPSAGDLGRAALAAAEGRHVTEVERTVARGAAAPHARDRDASTGLLRDEDRTAVLRDEDRTAVLRDEDRTAVLRDEDRTAVLRDEDRTAVLRDEDRTAVLRDEDRSAVLPEHEPAGRNGHAPAAGGPRRTEHQPAETMLLGDRPRRHRRRRAGSILAILVAAGVAVFAAVQLADGDGVDPTLLPGAPVSDGEVEQLVADFGDAYAQEDARKLERLLTRDAERIVPGARQRGRAAVIRSYKRQFADSDTRSFEVQELSATGGTTGRASGRYVATYAGEPDVTGTITFGVMRDRGTPRIAQIVAHQDAPAR